MSEANKNTDKEIWRQKSGDYYSPSIFVTENNGIGINIDGHVIVTSIENWYGIFKKADMLECELEKVRAELRDAESNKHAQLIVAVEFGCRQCEKGLNLESTLGELNAMLKEREKL